MKLIARNGMVIGYDLDRLWHVVDEIGLGGLVEKVDYGERGIDYFLQGRFLFRIKAENAEEFQELIGFTFGVNESFIKNES